MHFTLTIEALAAHLGMSGEGHAVEVERVYQVAVDTLNAALVGAWRPLPQSIADDCLIRVAQALRDAARRSSRAGKQLAAIDRGTAGPQPLDPLDPVRSILSHYVVGIG